jgi:hypothetical protein
MRKQSRQADGGPVGQSKRAALTKYLLKKRELNKSFSSNGTRAKGSPLVSKKELLTPGKVAEGN